jgi:hypothetical protein
VLGMARASEWAERVAAWKASGKTSDDFSQGQPFTGGGLRHWAYRLGKTRRRAGTVGPARRKVRLARVVRVASPASAPEMVGKPTVDEALTVEVAGARVIIPRRFERTTLEEVLAVLEARGSGRGGRR